MAVKLQNIFVRVVNDGFLSRKFYRPAFTDFAFIEFPFRPDSVKF